MMQKKYLYAICHQVNFSLENMVGISNQPLLSKKIGLICVLYSEYPDNESLPVMSSRQNLLKHQEILEKLYAHANLLPLKFGTVKEDTEIETLISEKVSEFDDALRYFADKTEVVIKGFWQDMSVVYTHIVQNSPDIKQFKDKLEVGAMPNTQNNLIKVGQMVAEALAQYKTNIQNLYLQAFKDIVIGVLPQEVNHEALFLNIAFLIPKAQVTTFEEILDKIPISQDANVRIKYYGIAPPNHFL